MTGGASLFKLRMSIYSVNHIRIFAWPSERIFEYIRSNLITYSTFYYLISDYLFRPTLLLSVSVGAEAALCYIGRMRVRSNGWHIMCRRSNISPSSMIDKLEFLVTLNLFCVYLYYLNIINYVIKLQYANVRQC